MHLTTSTDWRLARWYIELGNSPRPDGILPMSMVGEIENSQQHTIPDWSLNWIHGVHNLHRYDPSDAGQTVVRDALPTVRKILGWYLPYLTDGGVLADVPEWNLVDWSSILLTGTSSILTALWARALREYADINHQLANNAEVDWAENLWTRARDGFHVFWDEAWGAYVDHLVHDHQQPPASQIAGAAAIVAGLVDGNKLPRVLAWIRDRKRLVTRSWIGGAGGYDTGKIIDQLKGIQRIDWKAETEVAQAQPFAAYLVHDAYRQCRRPDLIVDNVRRWSQFLRDRYDTFGECWGWGTPAHGWSSTPTCDMVTAVLGVTPAGPGFARASITPAYGLLDRMAGAVPTPHGLLHVDVQGDTVQIDSPIPFTLELSDGSVTHHKAGKWSSNSSP